MGKTYSCGRPTMAPVFEDEGLGPLATFSLGAASGTTTARLKAPLGAREGTCGKAREEVDSCVAVARSGGIAVASAFGRLLGITEALSAIVVTKGSTVPPSLTGLIENMISTLSPPSAPSFPSFRTLLLASHLQGEGRASCLEKGLKVNIKMSWTHHRVVRSRRTRQMFHSACSFC